AHQQTRRRVLRRRHRGRAPVRRVATGGSPHRGCPFRRQSRSGQGPGTAADGGRPGVTDRPLVALTTSVDQRSGAHGRPSVFLYTSYIAALEAIGLATVLITPAHSSESISALLAQCRGLVLTGGEDVDPARYGEAPSPALGEVTPERDEMEFT